MAFRIGVPLLAILAVLAISAPSVYAQSQATTGVIEGRVLDETGAVLPGATVVLTNVGTNFQKSLVTDGDGRFRGVLMPLGDYRIAVSLQGFTTQIQEGIELDLGRTITLVFELAQSAFEDEIVVVSESPLVETSRTSNAVSLDDEAMFGLPNNGRNWVKFMNLTPGVGVVQGPDGDEITVNGQKGIQNNVSVDGADFNNPFFGEQRGGQRPAFTFNVDAIEELVVVSDGAPAEFGRASAGFVNVVTKSGTNELHGTANLYYQDDSLKTEAERRDGSKEPTFPSERTQVGFTLGGPLKQDRVFFFLAGDVQRGESTKQNDPDRIEQRVVDVLASLGAPNENGPINRTDDHEVALVKLDWNASNDNLATFHYTYTDSEQENGTFDVDSWGVSSNAVELVSSWSLGGSLVSTLGDNKLNEARLQYAFEDRPRPYTGPTFTGTDRPMPDMAFDFGRGYRFGMPFFIPVIYDDSRWQLLDNLTVLAGEHTIKAGFEYNYTEAFQTFIGFANALYKFGSTDGFINFVNNPLYVECSDGSSSATGACPQGTSPVGPVLLFLQQAGVGDITVEEAGTQTIDTSEFALFVQDLWQPRSNLTLSFGLRWEGQDNPSVITPPDEVFFADFIGQTVNGQEFPSNGDIPDDMEMWQPRLGLSWDPKSNGKTVVRANAGRYNARVPGLYLASTRSTNGSRGQTVFRSSDTPFLGLPPPVDQLLDVSDVGIPFQPNVYVFDKNYENPDTDAFAIAVEHEVASGLAALLKYNYADTTHLVRMYNSNDPLLGGNWFTGLGEDGSNGVNELWTVQSSAKSKYWGITAGLKGRIGTRISLNAFYTYSEDKSDDDNERDPFLFRYARITELDKEWSYSDRDQRHRVNAWLLWTAPYGFNVNLTYAYRSAQPQSITETGEVAAEPGDRINADGTVTRRNLGRKDNQFSALDIRLSKIFKLGAVDLEVIGEVFNAFNSANFRTPQVTNLVFNFDGTIRSGVGDPRQFQLGARVIW